MKALLDKIPEKALLFALDVSFALLLICEWLFRHTALSQGALVLFSCLTLLAVLRNRRFCLSPLFFCFFGMILMGLIGTLCWSVDAPTSLAMVKTLCVCTAFLVFFYQYALLRGDVNRILLLYVIAAACFLTGVILRSCPAPFETRLGLKAGVNPNDVAFVSSTAFAILLYFLLERPRQRLPLLFCLLVPISVLFLTSSLKSLFSIGACIYCYILLRYPKYAKRNAILLFLLGALLLYLLTMEGFLARWPAVYYRVTYRLQKIIDYLFRGMYWREVSIDARGKFISLGFDLFLKRPVTGYGLDCFRFFTGAEHTYSHNNYIELLVSGGLPMLALFYAPYALALKKGFAARKDHSIIKLLFILTLLQLALDWAMVSYYERTVLMIPTLLFAVIRAKEGTPDDLPSIRKYALNPCRFLSTRASHGGLRFLPDSVFLPLVYRGRLNRRLHLNPPVKMTEWLQWQKLYDRRSIYNTFADKLAAREYVKSRLGKDYLIPLLGVWDSAHDIDFDALPDKFALKCTHDSGGVIVCADKAHFNRAAAVKFLEKKRARDYYYTCREWAYKGLPRKILAEAFIGAPDGTLPDDYKIFCFNGVPRAVVLCQNRTKSHADYYFLTPDWQLFPVNDVTCRAQEEGFLPTRPVLLDKLLQTAAVLSEGVPQLRVDLYAFGERVLFGELTLYDQGGFADDYAPGGDERMGAFFSPALFAEKAEK